MKNVITGFLGAFLTALVLATTTPPNMRLTSAVDPSTGHLVWNIPFVVGAILAGFLIGAVLGNLRVSRGSGGDASVQAPTGTAQPDIYDQIRKLGELREGGVLTAEEFETKKAELLARSTGPAIG